MRSCVVLIAAFLVASFLLKTCTSANPLGSALESAGAIPPVEVRHEYRDWFLKMGRSGYLVFVNKSANSAVITDARIVRRNGKVQKLQGAPSLIKPNDVTEMMLMDGWSHFQPTPGDRIEIRFDGYPILRVIEFGPTEE